MDPYNERSYSMGDVERALNRAADEILDAISAPDTGMRDAMNLLVNAGCSYLEGSAESLADVANNCYEQRLDTILGWITEGL